MTISMRGLLRVAVVSAIVLTQIGAAPQREPYVTSWYLHPQRLIDVGGRRMNIICSGTGSPTVILDAGLGADATAWRLVQPAVARHTRVCSYDRAGMGFSDPTKSPRDASAIVHDLHALLRRAGISPPYVLVGWSIAGLYTRLYEYRYPNEVVGLVEVDPDSEFDENASRIVPAIMHKTRGWFDQQKRDWYKQFDDCAVNVSRGKCAFFPGGLAGYRKAVRAAGCPHVDPADCAVAEVAGEHQDRASLWKDEALELESEAKGRAEVRAEQRAYGDLPLIVLTDSEEGDLDHAGPVSLAAQRAVWVAKNEAQERTARLSSVGAHFVVAGSTHAIQLDHPSIIISAVDEVVDQARYSVHPERSSRHNVP